MAALKVWDGSQWVTVTVGLAALWRTGNGAPSNALGQDGDMYLDTATYTVYARELGVYNSKGSIAGAAGADGADGNTWINGTVDPTTEGVNGDLYLNTTSGEMFSKSGGTWSSIGAPYVGPQGPTGPEGPSGGTGIAVAMSIALG